MKVELSGQVELLRARELGLLPLATEACGRGISGCSRLDFKGDRTFTGDLLWIRSSGGYPIGFWMFWCSGAAWRILEGQNVFSLASC